MLASKEFASALFFVVMATICTNVFNWTYLGILLALFVLLFVSNLAE